MLKLFGAIAVGALATFAMAGTAFSMDCTNASRDMHNPAAGAQVQKQGEKWTLVLVRELKHPPQDVWRALTEPDRLAFDHARILADGVTWELGVRPGHAPLLRCAGDRYVVAR